MTDSKNADIAVPTPPTDSAPEEATTGPDLTGKNLGEFQILRRIGQGGMGQVYLARQTTLNRQVAIKILRPDLAADATALRRFGVEAQAIARITHANIVQVYASGQVDGIPFMALEYVEGRNLRDYLQRKGTLELPTALSIMKQVAAALQRAGEAGIVHRDIKPENILVTKKGEVKVADFGLSVCFRKDEAQNITQSGVTMGTPLYMSPEQVQGKKVDHRSDIYSFGVTCFHMLTGRPPFRGATSFEVALQHVQAAVPRLLDARPDLPTELADLIHRMLAKNPEDRPQTAQEIVRELNRLKQGVRGQLAAISPTPTQGLPLSAGETAPPIQAAAATGMIAAPTAPRRLFWVYSAVGIIAAAIGAGIHFLTAAAPSVAARPTDTEPISPVSTSTPRQDYEKLLRDRLSANDHRIADTLDTIAELTTLLIAERRFDEIEKLYTPIKIPWPARLDVPAPIFKQIHERPDKMLPTLGKAIVLTYKEEYNSALEHFRTLARPIPRDVLPKLPPHPRPRPAFYPIDLLTHDAKRMHRLIADTVERLAKATGKLEPDVDRLRSQPPRPLPSLREK